MTGWKARPLVTNLWDFHVFSKLQFYIGPLGDSFFRSDEQPELNLENDYPNKTGYNLKTNSSISIL